VDCDFRRMSGHGSPWDWAGVGSLPVLVSVLIGLYTINLLLHASVFSSRNPHIRPRAQNALLTLCRLLFCVPINAVLGFWLASWIVLWELVRAPLWKPKMVHRIPDEQASVAMCGGGFRTWYHLGVYWGLYDKLGVEGLRNVKFSGASIGALVAAVAASEVHPADIWAHIPAIAEAYRGDLLGHLTGVGQFCRYLLHTTLPEDAHVKVEGKLWISISSLFPMPHNVLKSKFKSRDDLINAIIAAQYIPAWTHPGVCLYDNMICVDGGVTNNLPALNETSLKIGLDLDDVQSWGADLVPSKPLARINTFIPADEQNLRNMLVRGKDDIAEWLKSERGARFVRRATSRL